MNDFLHPFMLPRRKNDFLHPFLLSRRKNDFLHPLRNIYRLGPYSRAC
jgi:hypothetical protein